MPNELIVITQKDSTILSPEDAKKLEEEVSEKTGLRVVVLPPGAHTLSIVSFVAEDAEDVDEDEETDEDYES